MADGGGGLQIRRDGRCPDQFQRRAEPFQKAPDLGRVSRRRRCFRHMFDDVEQQAVEIQPALCLPVGGLLAIHMQHAGDQLPDAVSLRLGARGVAFVRRVRERRQPVDGGAQDADFAQIVQIDGEGHKEVPSAQGAVGVGLPAECPPHVAGMAYPVEVLEVDFNLAMPDNGHLQRIMDVGAVEGFGPVDVPVHLERMGEGEMGVAVGHDVQFGQVDALGLLFRYSHGFIVRNDNFSKGMYKLPYLSNFACPINLL